MDRSDHGITFNTAGECNHCQRYDKFIANVTQQRTYSQENLRSLLADIKRSGKGQDYDCILGVSGGIDSSYLMYLSKQLGLRPLVVHFDNGWNSELAVSNIQKLIEGLDYDLVTYVVEWEEFKELQRAYFKASVVDIEVLTDHGMMATLFKYASDFNIHYVLDGQNFATEFTMPDGWNYSKYDLINIKDIIDTHSAVPIRSFPIYGILGNTGKFTNASLLNYIDYSKEKAIQTLSEKYGWRPYGAKHYESAFTKFYQGYILPTKFGIDKRRIHLSDLVRTGQIRREEAIKELEKKPYEPAELEADKEFVLKKLGFSEEEFTAIMAMPPVPHTAYAHAANLLASAVSRKKKLL